MVTKMWSFYEKLTFFYSPGFCHRKCATRSTVNLSERIESVIICKQCCKAQGATQVGNLHVPPTSPFFLKGQDSPNPITPTNYLKLDGGKGASTSLGPLEHSSEVKSNDLSSVTKKAKKSNWGLIWRKQNCEDTGIDFRLKKILMRGNVDKDVLNPVCRLCNKPYNADLMYICCEGCGSKFFYERICKIFISNHYLFSEQLLGAPIAWCNWFTTNTKIANTD